MKIIALWAAALGACLFFALDLINSRVSATVPGQYSQYRNSVTSNTLIRQTQSPIKRCMNMSAMEADVEGEWGYKIRRADLVRVAEAGFDTIRLPVNFAAHTEMRAPYRINPSIIRRTDQIVTWSLELGLTVIVDVHNYFDLNTNPDFHEPRLEAMWDQLARHYASAPAGVIFELINEPSEKMTVQRVERLNERLIARIRKDNPNRWLVVGGSNWGNLPDLLQSTPPRDPKIISTFHYYDPFKFTHQGASWTTPPLPLGPRWGTAADKASIQRDFAEARRWQLAHGNLPLFIGEFGVLNTVPDYQRAEWTEFVRKTAEQNGMSWCYWGWALGFGAYDLKNERWRAPIKQSLFD